MFHLTLTHQQDCKIPKFLNLGEQLIPYQEGPIYHFLEESDLVSQIGVHRLKEQGELHHQQKAEMQS